MNAISTHIGRWLARFLERPSRSYETFSITDTGGGYELQTNKGNVKTVFGIDLSQ